MDGATMTDGAKEDAMASSSAASAHPKPEELVAKAIAPIKIEYLRPPPVRASSSPSVDKAGPASDNAAYSASFLAKEKKSKRQLKRERQQEQKSVQNLCPEVAKTGNVNACSFGVKCRFSHDLDAFLAQKPADLPGNCPFSCEGACPYGMSCRFSGTHKETAGAETTIVEKRMREMNGLSKDVQKLLWKNKVRFPKADAELKRLGLSVKCNGKMQKEDIDQQDDGQVIVNGSDADQKNDNGEIVSDSVHEGGCILDSSLEKDSLDGELVIDDPRQLKKARNADDEKESSSQLENGSNVEAAHIEPEGVNGDDVVGTSEVDSSLKVNAREKKRIDFRGKLYLAPLTTVGNLPFRRVCKFLGADITCGEMAMCTNLLQGQASEWALLRRHSSEDLFGVQICGPYPDTVARTVELINNECSVDFIDINMGCPIDVVVNKGAGSFLLTKPMKMKNIIQSASCTVDKPLTIKVRTGYFDGRNRIDSLIADISNWGASAVTIHGRSRQQRYSKLADWDYIYQCTRKSPDVLQVLGNGDIFSYTDWNSHISECPELSTCMIARGALIKPWIFTEIKEQRHWDISSGERLAILKDYVHYGLEHWGSDTKGVETTRHFLLEWLSYTYRYIPVGVLDVIPQRLNWRPPSYYGRDDLETLMASDSAADWPPPSPPTLFSPAIVFPALPPPPPPVTVFPASHRPIASGLLAQPSLHLLNLVLSVALLHFRRSASVTPSSPHRHVVSVALLHFRRSASVLPRQASSSLPRSKSPYPDLRPAQVFHPSSSIRCCGAALPGCQDLLPCFPAQVCIPPSLTGVVFPAQVLSKLLRVEDIAAKLSFSDYVTFYEGMKRHNLMTSKIF
ncbi:hypothetical protein ACLOJK_027888 [Asimina triloba]